ncbi:MAG: hypothetical protein IH985_05355 [Planctomycetes bacterium]|nr:hypothetical protein [Planctomycetota bacterium]
MAKGDSFTLHIVASSLPAVGSYGAFQTFLGYGTLLYKPASPATEIHWPDGILPLRFPGVPVGDEGRVQHGDPGSFAELPISTYTGELFTEGITDIDLGGPMPLRFQRYYASHLRRGFIVGDLGSLRRRRVDWARMQVNAHLSTCSAPGRNRATDSGVNGRSLARD